MRDRSYWHPCTKLWQSRCHVGRIDMWMFHYELYEREGVNRLPFTGYKGAPDFSRPCGGA